MLHIFHYRICEIVSEYYQNEFLEEWKFKTDSTTINVLAALLVEKPDVMKVVVLTAGNTKKGECSYSTNSGNAEEYTWGLCDGHAESVCYRLASLYLITEMHRYKKSPEKSILEIKIGGYSLKNSIKFHFFTTQPPCGFMAKEERDFLSWKIPFKGKPHCLQCSSTILIGAYLGIQGPLSHLFSKPIYISSITIPKYKSVTTTKGTYIMSRFETFNARLEKNFHNTTDCNYGYKLVIPQVIIADVQSEKLFPECYKPWPYSDGSISKILQLETVERQGKKEAKNTAGTVSRSDSTSEPSVLVFTLKGGIGKSEFRAKMASQLKDATAKNFTGKSQVIKKLKEEQLKWLKQAQLRLSVALNVDEALIKLESSIVIKMNRRFTTHGKDSDELVTQVNEMLKGKIITGEIAVEVNKLKDSFFTIMQQHKSDCSIQETIASLTSLSEEAKKFKTDSKWMIDEYDKSMKNFEETTKSLLNELSDYHDYK